MKKSTIYDVAKIAGVSPGTVSRHLNGYELRVYNKIKVEQTIEVLGFKENIIAKRLKSHRSMTVAVLLPELTGLFSLDILKTIDLVLEEKGYTLIISDYERETQLFNMASDPWEIQNLSSSQPEKVVEMKETLYKLKDDWGDKNHPTGKAFWDFYSQ